MVNVAVMKMKLFLARYVANYNIDSAADVVQLFCLISVEKR